METAAENRLSVAMRLPKHEVVYTHTRAIYNGLIREFLAAMPRICENCGAASPSIVRDGFLKLFEVPIKSKSKQFATNAMPTKSALDFLTVSQLAKMEGVEEKEPEFAEAEMEEVMAAGLLHDIGFLELWKDGQEQTEFLQEYETERYEKHVVSGYNLIKKMNIDQRIKQAVLTHHERVNGSGFPLQVMGDNINWISRILAVADTYDALTMRQGDKAGISAFEAIKKMEDEGYNRLDTNYLMTFLKRIAETMIQRNVILNDGRMGRVVMINKYKLSCPLVQVGDAFVDLAKQSRYYIQEILEE